MAGNIKRSCGRCLDDHAAFSPAKILKVRLLVLGLRWYWLAVAGAFFAVCLDVPPTFAACFLVCATNRRVWVMDGAKCPVLCFILALCGFLRLGGAFCRLWGLRGLWGILRGHSCAGKEKKEAKKKRLGSGVGTHCKKYLGGERWFTYDNLEKRRGYSLRRCKTIGKGGFPRLFSGLRLCGCGLPL